MAKKHILIVDDEKDIRESVKLILEKNGYLVTTAVDGDSCLKTLTSANPDLILLDIMMPGTPVREVIAQLKGQRIVMLTAVRTTEAERQEILKSEDIIDFITKPFDLDDLLERVRKVVGE